MVPFFFKRAEVGAPCCNTGEKKTQGVEGGTNKIVWSQWLKLLWRQRAACKWDGQAAAATLRLHCRSFFFVLWPFSLRGGGREEKPASWPSALVCCLTAFRSRLDGCANIIPGSAEGAWRVLLVDHMTSSCSNSQTESHVPPVPMPQNHNNNNKKISLSYFFFRCNTEGKTKQRRTSNICCIMLTIMRFHIHNPQQSLIRRNSFFQ